MTTSIKKRPQLVPRFAVLTHDHPTLHWDLLLEDGDTLRSFRLAAPPCAGQTVDAEPLPPHRKLYLDYEGPVSGDRGTVTRWDAGEFTWLPNDPIAAAPDGRESNCGTPNASTPNAVACELRGTRFQGVVRLSNTSRDNLWTATFAAPRS